VQSYYQASRNTQIDQPELIGDHVADVCVIGGGYTGLSTALYLANEGVNVILIESNQIASGASGANGGQVSWRNAKRSILFGKSFRVWITQKFLWGIGEKSKYHAKELIDKYQIPV
jgi:gamma-glutamylputrescine oxidase